MLEKDNQQRLNRFDTRQSERLRRKHFSAGLHSQGLHHRRQFSISTTIAAASSYDRNGFLVRPALIGDVRPHAIKVAYHWIQR